MKFLRKVKFICLALPLLTSCQMFNRSDEASSGGSARTQKTSQDVSNLATDQASNTLKQRVLILPLLGQEPRYSKDFKEKTGESFRHELQRRGTVLAMSPGDFKIDVSKYFSDGKYQLKEMAADARKAGAAAILEASIVDFRVKSTADSVGIIRQVSTDFEALVKVRIQNIVQGKEVFNTTKTVQFKDQNVRVAERVNADRFMATNPELASVILKDALLEFVPQISALFQNNTSDWQGRIAALQGDRVYLNVGQVSGIQLGDILKVTDDGDEVFDPQTGILIGQAPGRVKGTLEVVSYFGKDGAIAVIRSGAGIKENDRVTGSY